jgi:hypothetical protein
VLFGASWNVQWCGKTFYGRKAPTEGINRFLIRTSLDQINAKPVSAIKSRVSLSPPCNFRNLHAFTYSLQPSAIDSSSPSSTPSVTLQYHPFHPWFSLWYSMRDELRWIPLPATDDSSKEEDRDALWIGMGSMIWSGGPLNSSPFVLWRPSTTANVSTSRIRQQ